LILHFLLYLLEILKLKEHVEERIKESNPDAHRAPLQVRASREQLRGSPSTGDTHCAIVPPFD